MCKNLVVEEQYRRLDEFIHSLPNKQGNLIAILHKAQEIFGYLPEEVQRYVAQKIDVPAAKVYGVVSFYSFFTMKPRGKHVINICMGTACYVRGGERLLREIETQLKIKPGETTSDGMFSLDALRCVGACGLAPVMIVDGKVYGRLRPTEVMKIVTDYREGRGE